MNLKAFCVHFFKHILKVSAILFFFGTAIINHFIQRIYILFVMFKYVFHHYCDVADLADEGYIHYNQQADAAALD